MVGVTGLASRREFEFLIGVKPPPTTTTLCQPPPPPPNFQALTHTTPPSSSRNVSHLIDQSLLVGSCGSSGS